MQIKTRILDKFGIWASSLCAAHCLLLPVLLPLIPLMSASFVAQAWFERSILIISLIAGFWAVLSGFYRYHRQVYPIISIALGGMIYWNKDVLGEAYEPFTIAIGAMLIVFAHIANLKLCQRAKQAES